MKKQTFKKLDLDMYYEKIDNGLDVYVVPFKDAKNIYVNFSTDYGSIQREFVPLNGKKMIKVPDGIAHFLEHKMFEQPDIKPFEFFSERGTSVNANTNYYKTSYLFSGPSFFSENLNYLLNYVQNPYFTDENVNKEKGIIEQEIKMYEDEPEVVLYEGLLYNLIVSHPLKHSIIGTIDSINSITKEDLYTCYNTFYHPSNMFVTVSGNVDPKEVIDIVKKNQSEKTFEKANEIKVKTYNEIDTVSKIHETKKMNVGISKVGIGYKFNITNIDLPLRTIHCYFNILFDIMFGGTSEFLENIKTQGIIHNEIDVDFIDIRTHILAVMFAECETPDKIISKIKNSVNNISITKEELERKKKVMISSLMYLSDSIYSMNSKIMNNLIKYKKVYTNDYEIIRKLNMDEFLSFVNKLSFDNISTFIIEPKK